MTLFCRCPDRADAERQGAFVRAPAVGGWVDLSAGRAIRKNGFGYTYTACPWCGTDLPPVPLQPPPGDVSTAWSEA